jgi:outer membrane receptor protein involved in Fe transport
MNRKKLSIAVRNALNAGVMVGLAAPFAYGQTVTQSDDQAPVQVAQQPTQEQPAQPPRQPREARPQFPPQAEPATGTAGMPPLQGEPPRIERLSVTGSRIPISPNITSTSPISQITASDIRLEGVTSTEAVVNRLPQAYADYGSNVSNGSTGTSTTNLRNLGATRTLVLIDGKRLPAGSPLYWATDLQNIPTPLIQRVEVLTGGASAVYGSDAVAGVVNFIMNDSFEGLQFQYNGQGYNHQQHNGISSAVAARQATNPLQFQVPGNVGLGGEIQDFNMVMGSNFAGNKGNATVYFEYRHQTPVLQSQYDYGACALGAVQTDSSPQLCSGSSTSFPGRFLNGNNGKSYTIADAAGNVRPFNGNTDQFNFGPYNYYQTQNERYLANVFAHYDVFPEARVYAEFDFSDSDNLAQVAASGLFFGGAGPNGAAPDIFLYDNNPLLSQSFKNAMGITPGSPGDLFIGRRAIENGNRQSDIRNTDYRYVLGVKGDFGNHAWDYDFWWQSGKTIYQETDKNYVSVSKSFKAINVVTDPSTGKPACASALDGTDLHCVPWDIFHLGGVTPAAVNYLTEPGLISGYTSQSVVGLQIRSDLGASYGWKLPWAVDGVGVAAGVERRVEKLSYQPDASLQNVDLGGQGGARLPSMGQYTVVEPYVEIRVPIIEEKPFAYLLNVSGSYRYSNYYTQSQTTNSYGVGGQWAPLKGYMFRASYQQASRAPNVIDLFLGTGLNLFSFAADPCGPNPSATVAQCLRSGLPANLYGNELLNNPAGQGNYLQGGNVNLLPETSKSYTYGIVLTPLPKFNASIDYWNIKLGNAIANIAPSLSLNNCLNGVMTASFDFCKFIHRDTRGTLWTVGYIDGTNLNLGQYKTNGWDVALNYVWDMPAQWGGWGSILFNFLGTYVHEFLTTPIPGLGTYNCAGLFGTVCGTPQPHWRNNFRTTWATPWNWDLSLNWRYFGQTSLDATSGDPQLAGSYSTVDAKIPARNYWDLAASWNINKTWTVRGGVNNILDQDPPIISSTIAGPPFGNGNTYPQGYDCCGRTLFVNLQAKF